MNFVHPSQIVLEYYLGNPSFVVSAGKEEILETIITNKVKITENIANILAGVFCTSKEFWLNIQKQYDSALVDFEEFLETSHDTFKGSQKTILKGCPTKVLVSAHTENGHEIIEPVYIITEQAYKHLISKCNHTDLWDLGYLGCSEKNIKKVEMPEAIKRLIAAKKQEQINPAIHELVQMGNGIGGTRLSGKTREETEEIFKQVMNKAKE